MKIKNPMSKPKRRTMRRWPLTLIAAPAAVATWSGWVGLGEKAGFGEVEPLPGIAEWTINTAITLPIGVEVYAAFAMSAWLSGGDQLSDKTRGFAKWSALGSLVLGMLGQVAYHLLEVSKGPTPKVVVVIVACLPVLVLGLGAALGHMMSHDLKGLSEADEDLTEGSLSEASKAMISEPAGLTDTSPSEAETKIIVNPADLTGEPARGSLGEPPVTLTAEPVGEPSAALTEAPSSEPPATLTGEAPEAPASEASEAAPVNPPAPVSEPAAAPPVKPARAPRQAARKKKATPKGKVEISALGDDDLLELLAQDFGDEELSANKIRLRYGIGTDKAKVIFERWKDLTEVTDAALAAVGE